MFFYLKDDAPGFQQSRLVILTNNLTLTYGPSLDQSGTEENLKMCRSSDSFSEIYLSYIPPTSSFLQSTDQRSITASLSLFSRLRSPIRPSVSPSASPSLNQSVSVTETSVSPAGCSVSDAGRQQAVHSSRVSPSLPVTHYFLFFSWRANNSLQPAGHSASQYLTSTSLHLHSHRRCLRSQAPFFISMIITGRGWKPSGPSNVTSNSCGRVLNAARLGVFHRVKDDPRLLNISVDWTETASVAELMFITRFYFSLLC